MPDVAFLSALIVNTFASFAFCHLVYLHVRKYGLRSDGWGGWSWRALTLYFAVSYLFHLSGYLTFALSDGALTQSPRSARLIWAIVRPFGGPLLMQLFYQTERARLRESWVWGALIRTVWALATAVSAYWTWLNLWAPQARPGRWGVSPPALSDGILGVAVLFLTVVVWMSRRPDDTIVRRRRRRGYLTLSVFVLVSLLVAPVGWDSWVDLAFHSTPLVFVIITVYYGERLTFFDVFAKRGLLFLAMLVTLTGYFAVVAPRLEFRRVTDMKAWMAALMLLPFGLATPWLNSTLSAWVDRVWLGRRFTPLAALTSFWESTQGAAGEADLVERAELSLSQIFGSRASIERGHAPSVRGELVAPVEVGRVEWGSARVAPRPDEVPFLSEDVELMKLLAYALGSMLERCSHAQRERDLVLSAAQSELKALRAQINPHFLFNALNTIAALIPQRPERAEQTVEQLAEVFRYTVRRAEHEWVRLADEIEFVRSYLEIEKARFGARLDIRFEVESRAGEVPIPAMVIQTMAENAVKHGVSSLRGPGLIRISARLRDGHLHVRVEDNGAGFDRPLRPDGLPEPSTSGGLGLRNIQERLRAHYGSAAHLEFSRNAATTLVSLDIPAGWEVGGARSNRG